MTSKTEPPEYLFIRKNRIADSSYSTIGCTAITHTRSFRKSTNRQLKLIEIEDGIKVRNGKLGTFKANRFACIYNSK
ncbi:hypothetical protein K0M31_001152 [Melipona bicolor]|uniref:Uncharacterized protein n=1 Tax=Melipona bicolor TaxID=60889 RepID=A0AA40GEY5_9HYME|nr:hypothetical protein K0M31_001152 [Melipona bicolor]